MTPTKHKVQYGRSIIEFGLEFNERETLAITVRPDRSVVVKAPAGAKLEAINAKLQKKGKWLIKQINYFDKFHPIQPPRQYLPGETHSYLGRKYRLRVRRGSGDRVRLSGKFFFVETNTPKDQHRIKLLMLDWYATHAKAFLDQRIQDLAPDILNGRSKTIEIEYRTMKSRWGYCVNDHLLKINVDLIKMPLDCIDYVIVHEICHLIHPNHDKKFYKQLEAILPNWSERKEKLELFSVS